MADPAGKLPGISGNHLFYADMEKHTWNPAVDRNETQNGEKILHPYSKDIVSLFLEVSIRKKIFESSA